MKKLRLLFSALALLLCSTSLLAHDFWFDGIYYKITSRTDLTVEVTYGGSSYDSYSYEYSGSVAIPETVTYNGNTYSVTSIESGTFYRCSGLTSVTIPNSVTNIGQSAFDYCSGLTSVTIPNSVTSIGSSAFSNCSGLTSVTIPNSVTSIGDYAFYRCSGLTSVSIPNSVTSIGDYAFNGCSDLISVKVDEANQTYDSRNNSNAIIETETNKLIVGCKSTVIPNSVTSIGSSAFRSCSDLTSVTIPNSVTSIGFRAFSNCDGLTSVTIPNSVTSIGDYAFEDCDGLTEVTIGNSVTSIEYRAFYDCDGLTEVTIGNSVTSIGGWAFYGCSGLTSVTIPNSVTSIEESAFEDCSGLTSVTIPNSVTSIGPSAFRSCSGLTSVTIPNNVTSIEHSTFRSCSGLTSVTIPNSVTSIGSSAFYDCSGLTSVHISDIAAWCKIDFDSNPLSYAKHLFLDGEEIKDLVIPNSVTSIGSSAFKGCSGLTSVAIPNSVTSIGDDAFRSCSGLTSVTIPNSVTSIGDYAFIGCSGLTSVDIPNSVTSIGEWAFSACDGLTSVTIGNNVTNIGSEAFSDCPSLTDVYCLAASVPETYYNAFHHSNFGNATLHVPAGSVEAYAAAEPWSGFGEIVALPAEEVELTIGTTGATTFCSEYALDFTDAEGVKAYAATGYNTETGVVTLTRVKTAKAGTGLFVVGDEGTYSIPTIESSADNSLNMLVGTTEEVTIPAVDGTYINYIYGKSDDNTGFFKLTGDKVIPAGKAYLQIPTAWFPVVAESKIKIEFEDGTTTGIDDVEEQVRPNDGVIYDLHGRVVKNPGKGIYIVNGKKVLF